MGYEDEEMMALIIRMDERVSQIHKGLFGNGGGPREGLMHRVSVLETRDAEAAESARLAAIRAERAADNAPTMGTQVKTSLATTIGGFVLLIAARYLGIDPTGILK